MGERTVLCFGDSNTHGTVALAHPMDRRRFPRDVRWPGVLATSLGAGWHVIEEGHPARTTVHPDPVEGLHKNGISVLPALLESHRPLDLVIVMLGTNDLKMRYSVPALDIALGVERLLLTVKGSDCGIDGAPPTVLLVSPVPIEEVGFLGEIFAGGAEKSHQISKYIEAIADRHSAGFLDAGAHAALDPVDGVHLTAEGQMALGRAMADAVRSFME